MALDREYVTTVLLAVRQEMIRERQAVGDEQWQLAVARWGEAGAINCGWCVEFAERVQDRLPEIDHDFTEEVDDPGHCWLTFEDSSGRTWHLDAEAPYGVRHWRDLPIFTNAAPRRAALKAHGCDSIQYGNTVEGVYRHPCYIV